MLLECEVKTLMETMNVILDGEIPFLFNPIEPIPFHLFLDLLFFGMLVTERGRLSLRGGESVVQVPIRYPLSIVSCHLCCSKMNEVHYYIETSAKEKSKKV